MLEVENLGYDTWQTIYFQRGTVLASELVLAYALQRYMDINRGLRISLMWPHRFVSDSPGSSRTASHALALSILLSPAFLIIDHIHFQYNGFLYGILILSLVLMQKQSSMLAGGLLFAVLLCFKHIYLYLAPAYFVYLLRAYCLHPGSIFYIRYGKSSKLAIGLIGLFGACFGPFLYWGQLDQLLTRLFPFSRGLCHSYWAPNVWALYSFSDRVLLKGMFFNICSTKGLLTILVAPRLGLTVDRAAVDSVTRGLVGDTSFAVLPAISPRTTFLWTVFFQMVILACGKFTGEHADTIQLCLGKLFLRPSWDMFIRAVTLCGYASFLFGWHVHEKAVLLIIIPFSLVALRDRRHLGAFRPLAVAGNVSLFPLLFTAGEFPVKSIYTVFWLVLFLSAFDQIAPVSSRTRLFLFDRFTILYIAISIPLLLYCSLLHPLFFGDKYEFLPLMFISSYSAIGVVGSWVGFSVVYFTS